jgi:hypothetical protein
MLRDLIDACLSSAWIKDALIGKDVAIALAYFAIPAAMLWVLRDREDDLAYPWLWMLFMAFIVACGMTHVAHAWSMITGLEYLSAHLVIGAITAMVSVGTAIAFINVLPQIRQLPSPSKQKAELERLVAQKTKEKDALIKEINHRVGNQLQTISSMIAVETRRASDQRCIDLLGRLKTELERMNRDHIHASQKDYGEEITLWLKEPARASAS